MRSIWDGVISFGLVNIPVKLFSAENSNDLKFNLIDKRDENRIKYLKVNEVTGEQVASENIAKAYRFDDGTYVVMTDEDFAKADAAATKSMDIEAFILREELSLLYLEKPYYIVPNKVGAKPYALLREAMKEAGRIAVARVVLRTKGYLAAIYAHGDALVLNLIRYHDQVRSAQALNIPPSEKVSEKEMALAKTLIEGMTEAWKPENYRDEYRDAVMERIERKARRLPAEEGEAPRDEATPGKVIDIMDLLKRSVEQKKPQKPKKASRG